MKKTRCKRVCGSREEEKDILSSLPHNVLVHILSFLPARDAARTCLLRAFGDLWTNIESLDFRDSPFQVENWPCRSGVPLNEPIAEVKFMRFVRSFLLLHKRSKIRELRLEFDNQLQVIALEFENETNQEEEEQKQKLQNEIEVWLKVAFGRGVEVLHLGFGVLDYQPDLLTFSLPCFVWTSKVLVELTLFNCYIELPRSVKMDCLKVLKLDSVGRLNDKKLSKITRACHLLQHLTINDCVFCDMPIPPVELTITCPNVRSFDFSGCVTYMRLMNLLSLKTTSFGLRFGCCGAFYGEELIVTFHKVVRFLESIQHAEVLKLNKEAFVVLTYGVVKTHPFPCNKWKSVQLDTWLNDKYISGIRSLLRYSSFLEELIIEVKYPLEGLDEDVEDELHDFEYAGLNNCSEWLIHGLKKVTMRGLFKSLLVAQVDLVKVILKNAPVLDKFLIFAEGNAQPDDKESDDEDTLSFGELFSISKKLLTFPRASTQAMVFLE